MVPRRLHSSHAAIQALAPDDRAFRRSLTDEVAIDFPSASAAVQCLRRSVADPDMAEVVSAEIVLDRAQAATGALVPLTLGVRHTCTHCGGRGEVWDEICASCCGDGDAVCPLWIEVRVPAGRGQRRPPAVCHHATAWTTHARGRPPGGDGTAVKRHVDFLSWLYLAWGFIFLLVALAGGALAAGALAISTGASPVQVSSPMAARFTAVSLLVVAGIAMLWAALHLWIGRALGGYTPRARLLALGLAVVNMVLLPFGTALGAYACWVLLKDEGRNVFHE